jgi:hypothetical protein
MRRERGNGRRARRAGAASAWVLAGVAVVVVGAFASRRTSSPEAVIPARSSLGTNVAQSGESSLQDLFAKFRGSNPISCELAMVGVENMGGWWHDGERGPRTVVPLDPSTRAWLLDSIPTEAAVPELRRSLDDADSCVRRVAASVLARVDGPRALDALIDGLGATSEQTRELSAYALGLTDSTRAVAALVRSLRDQAARVRGQSAWALGRLDDVGAVSPLVSALGDTDAFVRRSAARALGNLESRDAIEPLTRLLARDTDASVRRAAAQALGEISG